jgi:hypothetical protein
MLIADRIALTLTHNPKGTALFAKRAAALLGEKAEGKTCPFWLAGRLARELNDDQQVLHLLFRSLADSTK